MVTTTTATEALIAKTTFTRRDTDESGTQRRRIKTEFILDETRGQGENGESYIYLSIVTHHVPEQKYYRVSINRIFRDGYVDHLSYSSDYFGADRSPVSDYAVKTARHSARALTAVHQEAMARVLEPETFQSLMEWASRADTRD